jgi:hypothetical protein
MKRTPQKTMVVAWVRAAARHNASESPVKSGTEWNSAGSM